MPRFDPKAKLKEAKSQGIVSELLEQPAPTVKPASKGGRPRGIPKTKKTFYLAADMGLFEQVRLDLAAISRILVKDESDTVDLALALLATLAAQPEHIELIRAINKKRAAKTEL